MHIFSSKSTHDILGYITTKHTVCEKAYTRPHTPTHPPPNTQSHKNNVVAVIGDGAITGGMAYEAMNHAGFLDSNMIVILNDNQQVSLPTQYNGQNQDPVGALSSALARLQANRCVFVWGGCMVCV